MRYSFYVLIFLILFSGFAIFFCHTEEADKQRKFEKHAAILAEDVWALNESNARSYLRLALTRDHFKSLSIVEKTGSSFLSITGSPLKGIDQFLFSINIIPVRTLTADIAHQEKIIAILRGEQYVRLFYPLFNLLIFLAFITLAAVFVGTLFVNRKRLEEQVKERTRNLNESQKRFHDLVDLLPEMVWETDREGHITYANKKAFQQLGLSSEITEGVNAYDFWLSSIDPPQQDQAIEYFRQVIAGHHQELQDFTARNPKDETFPLLIRSAPIVHEKKIVGARCVAIDITERHRLEDQLKKAERMKAIGLMAGGVAHDLNNILSGIVTYPELLLLDLPEGSPLRPGIEAVRSSGLAAAEVVSDLLTVARGVASSKSVADSRTIIKEYLSSPEYLRLKSLHPEVEVNAKLPVKAAYMHCSPIHIRKCIMNLVTNGMEAIQGEGVVTILVKQVRLERADPDALGVKGGKYVILQVKDDGPGISADDQKHIFEPFYTKKILGRSGTGLGLTVVWNTVKEHDGAVKVTSSDAGTTIDLYFPSAEAAESHRVEDGEFSGDLQGSGQDILVVDDESRQRQIASHILHSLNYNVSSVASGEEALRHLRTGKTDLLILDMIMEPGLNGRQTYEQALKINPQLKAIIVSGFSESEDVRAALKMGAGAFLTKPYTMSQLGKAVYRELNQSHVKN